MENGFETNSATASRRQRHGRHGIKKMIFFLIFLAVCAGIAAVVMWLWNAIVPQVTGWGTLGYWQALGLMVLSRLLLGGFGKMHGFHNHWHAHRARKMHSDHFPGHHQEFHELRRQMSRMSQQERREFIRRRMAGMENPTASGCANEPSGDAQTGNME